MFFNGIPSQERGGTRNFHDKANNKACPRRKKNDKKKLVWEEWTARPPLWKAFNLMQKGAVY